MSRNSVIVALAMFVALLASNLPAPLYQAYRERFALSGLESTAVFAIYPILLIAGLVVLARLSDRFGRRRALQAALLCSAACSLLFLWEPAAFALYAGRAFAAVAVSLLTAAGVTALVELQPGHRSRAALIATFSVSLSCGVAPFLTGVLATFAAAPMQAAYAVQIVLALVVVAVLQLVPETAPRGTHGAPLLPRPLRLNPGTGGAFLLASFTAGIGWMVASLFVSVVPGYVAALLNVHNLAVQGSFALAVFAISPVIQVTMRRAADRDAIAIGLALTVLAIAAIIAAVPLHSIAVFALAALITGAGQGASFYGAQALINRISPNDRRAETAAAFYAINYAMVGIPILALGALESLTGIFDAFIIVGGTAAVCALALIAASRTVRVVRSAT